MFYIYCYTNKKNGKCYIGKTGNISQRKSRHRRNAFIEKLETPFYRALRKYGEDQFDFLILDKFNTEDIILDLEKFYIKNFKSNERNYGYNLTEGGEGSSGLKHNDNQIRSNKLKFGTNNGNSKLSNELARIIYEEYRNRIPLLDLSDKYNVAPITIERLLSGKSWKHLNLDIDALKIIKKENVVQRNNLFNAKLTSSDAYKICIDYINSVSIKFLASQYNVSIGTIQNVLSGKTFYNDQIDYEAVKKQKGKNKKLAAIQNSPYIRKNNE